MSSLLKGGTVLLVSACFATPGLAQSTARAEAITAPVKDRGIFRVATGTWDRTSGSALAAGAEVVFNHNAPTGYYNPQDPNQEQVGEGRVPSTNSQGTANAYTIQCWQTAYCTDSVPSFDVTMDARWFQQYNTCNDPDLDGAPGGATPAVLAGDSSVTGLPGAVIVGSQTCWIVTVDMTGTTDEFCLNADGNGQFDNIQDFDSFGWGMHMNVTGGSGVPANTGLILTGHPLNEAFGEGTDPLWGFGDLGVVGDGTGLDELDQFFIGDTTDASFNGCYWFGGYINNHIWGGHWHQLQGTDGGDPAGNFCDPGGQFVGVAGTAQISGPGVISLAAGQFDLSVVNMGPVNGADQPGQFVASHAPNGAPFALGNYVLCLDPTAGFQRLVPALLTVNGDLTQTLQIATGAQSPMGGAPITLMAGTTHYFQRWGREPNVGASSNLTNGIGICIVP